MSFKKFFPLLLLLTACSLTPEERRTQVTQDIQRHQCVAPEHQRPPPKVAQSSHANQRRHEVYHPNEPSYRRGPQPSSLEDGIGIKHKDIHSCGALKHRQEDSDICYSVELAVAEYLLVAYILGLISNFGDCVLVLDDLESVGDFWALVDLAKQSGEAGGVAFLVQEYWRIVAENAEE